MLLERFKTELKNFNWQDKKIIIAVSGGADSMVMAQLFHTSKVQIVIAHCNYGLRGEESDMDEQLVKKWAESQGISFYKKQFNLGHLLENEGGNLQGRARQQRYEWFEELRYNLGFHFVAVAHHQKDTVETMLINFFKGTGISGMHGILPRYGFIIRPLLSFSKTAIIDYAEQNKIPWRMDRSNLKDDYVRNKIRNQLLPLVEEMYPNVINNLTGNIERFKEVEILYQQRIAQYRKKLLEQRNKDWYIPILKLKHCVPLPTILYELLKPFGFQPAQIPHLLHLMEADSGKMMNSASHRIIKDRNFLIITLLSTEESTFLLIDEEPKNAQIDFPDFKLIKKKKTINPADIGSKIFSGKPEEAYIDFKKLIFPLVCRPWKQGDYFYPLGMGRKKKKVSRFLTDLKFSLPEKEKVWVLEQDKKIIWVLGLRLDERFKITHSTTEMICFSIRQK